MIYSPTLSIGLQAKEKGSFDPFGILCDADSITRAVVVVKNLNHVGAVKFQARSQAIKWVVDPYSNGFHDPYYPVLTECQAKEKGRTAPPRSY
jgi:hypothetical protein